MLGEDAQPSPRTPRSVFRHCGVKGQCQQLHILVPVLGAGSPAAFPLRSGPYCYIDNNNNNIITPTEYNPVYFRQCIIFKDIIYDRGGGGYASVDEKKYL